MTGHKDAKVKRKEARRMVEATLGKGFGALANIIRPRPRWVPVWAWAILFLPLFERTYYRFIIDLLKRQDVNA